MPTTVSALKFAVAESSVAFGCLLVWTLSRGGSWENAHYALLGMLILAIYSLTAVAVTVGFAALGRITRHRVARWLYIPLGLFVWLLLVRALDSAILFSVFSLSALLGIWVGLSERWSEQFQLQLLSVGVVSLGAAVLLSAFHAVHVMQPVPTVVLAYSVCIGIAGALFLGIPTHKGWQLGVGVFAIVLGLLLLREPFLPFSFLGLSPLPQHPYIKGSDPIKLLLFVIGIAAGVANGRNGYFHVLTSLQLRRLFIVAVSLFALCVLLGWEYSAADGVQEITVLLGTAWLFALVSARPRGSAPDEAFLPI